MGSTMWRQDSSRFDCRSDEGLKLLFTLWNSLTGQLGFELFHCYILFNCFNRKTIQIIRNNLNSDNYRARRFTRNGYFEPLGTFNVDFKLSCRFKTLSFKRRLHTVLLKRHVFPRAYIRGIQEARPPRNFKKKKK